MINEGKMAVVQGMEVSEPFGCREILNMPQCDAGEIDGWLDQLHDLGVRQLEIVNKFDNALTGVAGDSGSTGTITNAGNFATHRQLLGPRAVRATPTTTTTRRPRSPSPTTTTW